jgi:hypothetical protein
MFVETIAAFSSNTEIMSVGKTILDFMTPVSYIRILKTAIRKTAVPLKHKIRNL